MSILLLKLSFSALVPSRHFYSRASPVERHVRHTNFKLSLYPLIITYHAAEFWKCVIPRYRNERGKAHSSPGTCCRELDWLESSRDDRPMKDGGHLTAPTKLLQVIKVGVSRLEPLWIEKGRKSITFKARDRSSQQVLWSGEGGG